MKERPVNIDELIERVRIATARQLDLLDRIPEFSRAQCQSVAHAVAHPTFFGHALAETPDRAALAREVDRVTDRHWLTDAPPAELDTVISTAGQLELEFSGRNQRHNARQVLAEYIQRVICPVVDDSPIWDIPQRLREARTRGVLMYRPADGHRVFLWQKKAGLPLLCPDDARQEASRLKRRVIPAILERVAQGSTVHYMVGTMDNAAPGKLAATMRRCQQRVRAISKMQVDGKPRFPAIKGWMATLEAPLGSARTWNVHVNVLWIVDGYLDYADLQKAWGAWMHIERVGARNKKNPGVCDYDALEKTLKELVKYPVRTVAEKSDGKPKKKSSAADAAPAAPPMTEWTADEWLEWWSAHKGFRRTRTGGVLYRIPKPDRETLEGYKALGVVHWARGGYRLESSLLSSILGDKSSKLPSSEALTTAYRALCRRVLAPPEGSDMVLNAWRNANNWQKVYVE